MKLYLVRTYVREVESQTKTPLVGLPDIRYPLSTTTDPDPVDVISPFLPLSNRVLTHHLGRTELQPNLYSTPPPLLPLPL